jgi:hypothetical protein
VCFVSFCYCTHIVIGLLAVKLNLQLKNLLKNVTTVFLSASVNHVYVYKRSLHESLNMEDRWRTDEYRSSIIDLRYQAQI